LDAAGYQPDHPQRDLDATLVACLRPLDRHGTKDTRSDENEPVRFTPGRCLVVQMQSTVARRRTEMGKIIISENVSLDGVIQDPTGEEGFKHGGWLSQLGEQDREAWATVEFDEALGPRPRSSVGGATTTSPQGGRPEPVGGRTG
jgi:hypothetical protein